MRWSSYYGCAELIVEDTLLAALLFGAGSPSTQRASVRALAHSYSEQPFKRFWGSSYDGCLQGFRIDPEAYARELLGA